MALWFNCTAYNNASHRQTYLNVSILWYDPLWIQLLLNIPPARHPTSTTGHYSDWMALIYFIETRLLCNNNRFADYGNALKPSSLEDSHWRLREKTHATCWWSFGFHTLQELPIKHTIKLPQSEDGVENRTRLAPGQYRNEWNIKLSASVGGRTTRRDATAGKSNNPPREAPFARFRNVCKFPARERATLLNWEQSR